MIVKQYELDGRLEGITANGVEIVDGELVFYNFVYDDGGVIREFPMKKGTNLTISGTIKSHGEYNGIQQTYIERVKVKSINN